MARKLFIILICIAFSAENDEELLTKSIQALNIAFDFVLDDYTSMNVDGILGITEGQGHLQKAIGKTNDSRTLQDLLQLCNKSKTIYDLQAPNLKNFPYKYYVFNNYIIPPQHWERDIYFSYGQLNPNPIIHTGPYNVENPLEYFTYVTNNTFSEEQSDACLVEVAAASDDTKPHDCPLSDVCVDYMIKMPTEYSMRFPGYGVTHMLLLLQIARMRNCNIDLQKLNAAIKEECSYILWELRKNIQHGYISNLDDLLLEQIQMCGGEGFGEFLTKENLQYILERQNPHGGFGIKYLTRKQILNVKRHKRESDKMKYGCNNHSTGLGVTVLALYIRLLIEKPFLNKAFYEEPYNFRCRIVSSKVCNCAMYIPGRNENPVYQACLIRDGSVTHYAFNSLNTIHVASCYKGLHYVTRNNMMCVNLLIK